MADNPFGEKKGIVLNYEPLKNTIWYIQKRLNINSEVIYLSPQGEKLKYKNLNQNLKKNAIILICGRYSGIDERIIKYYINKEISIGDYIISGGEIAAMVFIDTIIRLIPKVINNKKSKKESFEKNLFEEPYYTKEKNIKNIPKVIISGHHKKINKWITKQKIKKTFIKRKDIL